MQFLFYAALTLYVTPYFALLPELGRSEQQRLDELEATIAEDANLEEITLAGKAGEVVNKVQAMKIVKAHGMAWNDEVRNLPIPLLCCLRGPTQGPATATHCLPLTRTPHSPTLVAR